MTADLAAYQLTDADRALVAEARSCFAQDYRYLENMLWAYHSVVRSRLAIKAKRSTGGRIASPKASMVKTLRTLDPRLVRYVNLGPGGCWVWTGGLTGSGQPAFRLGPERKVQPVRRWLYVEVVGPIPDGRDAMAPKTCTALCVRPDHVLILLNGWRTRKAIAQT